MANVIVVLRDYLPGVGIDEVTRGSLRRGGLNLVQRFGPDPHAVLGDINGRPWWCVSFHATERVRVANAQLAYVAKDGEIGPSEPRDPPRSIGAIERALDHCNLGF